MVGVSVRLTVASWFGHALGKQWREFLVAYGADGGFDVAGTGMELAIRCRIHASSTGSPAIAMEFAT